jgi:hypothetical protein
MKILAKRFFAIFMAALIIVSAVSSSFSAIAAERRMSYVDYNGTYWHYTADEYVPFNTDYNKMVSYFQQQLANRESVIEYNFATNDSKYSFDFTNSEQKANADAVAVTLLNDLEKSIFTTNVDNAALGDYLYNSIYYFSKSAMPYPSNYDPPTADGTRYCTYTITITAKYYTTLNQEKTIANFAKVFSTKFLSNCDNDYQKVKTIYDFVVRNTSYDEDVYANNYSSDTERFKNAHSAYGAIYGSLISSGKAVTAYDMSTRDSVTAQKIIDAADQGLSVCEGYAKLFCYLCTYNGINCRIVDGDYTNSSNKSSDPHEWNYVYLDDGSGDGYKWFQVDTTFASQKSYKSLDINNYDYFLCGSDDSNFSNTNHQQPFNYSDSSVKQQLYDWYAADNIASVENYQIPLVDLNRTFSSNNETVIIKRSTLFNTGEEEKTSFIITDKESSYEVEVNDDGTLSYEAVSGFNYNGHPSTFSVIVPYLSEREYNVEDIGTKTNCGKYNINVEGKNGTLYETTFSIIPLDMSNDVNNHYNDFNVQSSTSFTGSQIIPQVDVVDKFENKLQQDKDYDIKVYSDANHTVSTTIQNMGTYYIDIAYKGNYSGHYYFTFTVGKINLNEIKSNLSELEYLPAYFRNYAGVTDAATYYVKGGSHLKVGDMIVQPNIDFNVSSTGTIEYGDRGTITLTGLESSDKVEADSSMTFDYVVSQKFDISDNFDGAAADSNTTNIHYYTGSEITPTSFDYLDKMLVKGTDYKIVSYSDNIDAGDAKVVIEGINGCTGKATLKFKINPASITNAKITTSTSNGSLNYTLTFNGKTLVKNVDYTETKTNTSTGYTLTIKGIGNFVGSTSINVKTNSTSSYIKPTSSGNYITLSASTYTYDGKVKKPTVKLYNKNKKEINSYYYTVSYASGRKNVGTYKITVKFKNGYSGSISKSFVINPKNTSISSITAKSKGFTVKWKKYTTQTTGYQIQYATDSKFSKNCKTVTVSKNSTVSTTVSKLSAKKKYYVRIRTYKTVGSKKYYSSWSGSKTVTTKK